MSEIMCTETFVITMANQIALDRTSRIDSVIHRRYVRTGSAAQVSQTIMPGKYEGGFPRRTPRSLPRDFQERQLCFTEYTTLPQCHIALRILCVYSEGISHTFA